MPTLADFIKTGTAGTSGSFSNGAWCRPTHRTTCCLFVSGGQACCICIPQTATCFVVEMWGQGGGGAAMCCCMWSCVGGQGGDYGWFVCTTSNTNHILCICVCQCACCTPGVTGSPGQFARVSNCTTSLNYCVLGGLGGCAICNWGIGTTCCTCNGAYNVCRISNPVVAQSTPPVFLNFCCSNPNGTTPNAAIYTQTTTVAAAGIDNIFVPVSCGCFAFYRRGACGWSDPQAFPWFTSPFSGCMFHGVGGASYAGADQQWWTSNGTLTTPTYCGNNGHFPGGGGKSAGGCAGGCCLGSGGGDGLVLISWS